MTYGTWCYSSKKFRTWPHASLPSMMANSLSFTASRKWLARFLMCKWRGFYLKLTIRNTTWEDVMCHELLASSLVMLAYHFWIPMFVLLALWADKLSWRGAQPSNKRVHSGTLCASWSHIRSSKCSMRNWSRILRLLRLPGGPRFFWQKNTRKAQWVLPTMGFWNARQKRYIL